MERAFPFELKALQEDGTFTGLASTYGNVDLGGDAIMPGAFTGTLAEKGAERPLLWSHDSFEPIGLGTLADSSAGLTIAGALDLDTQAGRDAYSRLRKRIVKGLSIGYRTVKEKFEGSVRQLLEVDLWEVSLTTFPMNPAAQVQRVKGQLNTIRDFEKWLRDTGGFSRSEAKQIASHGWKGIGAADDSDEDQSEIMAWLKEQKSALTVDHSRGSYWAKD